MGMFDNVFVAARFGLPTVRSDIWQTKDDLGPGGDQLARVTLHPDCTISWQDSWQREPPRVFTGTEVARLIATLAGADETIEVDVKVVNGRVVEIRRVEIWEGDQEEGPIVWPTAAG